MKLETKVTVDIDTDELAESLSPNSLFELIKDLDEAVGNWEFTLKLYDHFEKLREQYDKEEHVHDFEEAEDGFCSCGESLKIVS